uniref:Uncharacterized protein n=1 Tax=Oryza nivara TaxID=4536 RepID=A0A0E0IQQ2_ORYNI
MFHRWVRGVPDLVVSWHGISLEALHACTQGYTRTSPGPRRRRAHVAGVQPQPGPVGELVLSEVRFFRSYAHHVAISDVAREMLRDISSRTALGRAFREDLTLLKGANLVLGVSCGYLLSHARAAAGRARGGAGMAGLEHGAVRHH